MFTRLLVPLDETPRDDEAIAVARGLASRSGASVVLMHAQEPPSDMEGMLKVSRYLGQRVQELGDAGIEARYVVESGRAPHAIISTSADHERPDLIIMTPHHRAWLDALRHPSVTVSTLAHAEAPVLVWPEHILERNVLARLALPGAEVLVPLDGSTHAERALPFATRLAQEFHRPLVLVRVVTPVVLAGAGLYTSHLAQETQGAALREARTYLGVLRRRLARETKLNVQSMVLRGSPSHELLRIAGAHTNSVMVLSTHGRNGFKRLMLGSVATALVRESPIPVFVISPRVPCDLDHVPARLTASGARATQR